MALVVMLKSVMHRGEILDAGSTADIDDGTAVDLVDRGLALFPKVDAPAPIVEDEAAPAAADAEPTEAEHPTTRRKRR